MSAAAVACDPAGLGRCSARFGPQFAEFAERLEGNHTTSSHADAAPSGFVGPFGSFRPEIAEALGRRPLGSLRAERGDGSAELGPFIGPFCRYSPGVAYGVPALVCDAIAAATR